MKKQLIPAFARQIDVRDMAIQIYLDWANEFASVEKFASYYGLTETDATNLIDVCRAIASKPHMDA